MKINDSDKRRLIGANDKLVSMVKMANFKETNNNKRAGFWYGINMYNKNEEKEKREYKTYSTDTFESALKQIEKYADNCIVEFEIASEAKDKYGNWYVEETDHVEMVELKQ